MSVLLRRFQVLVQAQAKLFLFSIFLHLVQKAEKATSAKNRVLYQNSYLKTSLMAGWGKTLPSALLDLNLSVGRFNNNNIFQLFIWIRKLPYWIFEFQLFHLYLEVQYYINPCGLLTHKKTARRTANISWYWYATFR